MLELCHYKNNEKMHKLMHLECARENDKDDEAEEAAVEV